MQGASADLTVFPASVLEFNSQAWAPRLSPGCFSSLDAKLRIDDDEFRTEQTVNPRLPRCFLAWSRRLC